MATLHPTLHTDNIDAGICKTCDEPVAFESDLESGAIEAEADVCWRSKSYCKQRNPVDWRERAKRAEAFISTMLDSICNRPEMWGSGINAELQLLLLLECKLAVSGSDTHAGVRGEFARFCRSHGYRGSVPLASENINEATLQELLCLFRKQMETK